MRRLTTIPLSKPIYILRSPIIGKTSPKMIRTIPRADWSNNFVETSYFVGKGITFFVGFYTSLQWLYYRKIRQEKEKDQ